MLKHYESSGNYLSSRDYQMAIRFDQGVHRNILFKQPHTTDGFFEITTWSGHLAITGDMGSFIFQRTSDMLGFFNTTAPNPAYWEEKVVAESRFGRGTKAFDLDVFEAEISEYKKESLASRGDSQTPENQNIINDAFEIFHLVDDVHSAVDAVRSFDYQAAGVEEDIDYNIMGKAEVYTFHFLFACHAVHFASHQYAAYKAQEDMT